MEALEFYIAELEEALVEKPGGTNAYLAQIKEAARNVITAFDAERVMGTYTRDLPTTSVAAVKRVLRDLGVRVVDEHTTRGAVGYTTLTYGTPEDEVEFPVAVVDVESAGPGEQLRVVQRFENVTQAEDFIGTLPDTDKVERGGYGIDAPENT